MYFVFSIKTKQMSVSHDKGKITQKKMSKSFSFDFDHYDMVKCHQNVNFEDIGIEPSTGKNEEF